MFNGQVPPGLGEGARTRYHNDRIRAAKSSMSGNQAAQNSLRETHKLPTRSSSSGIDNTSVIPPVMTRQGPLNLPTQISQPQQQPVDPIEAINNSVRFEKFLSSPELQQSVTRAKLRNFFRTGDKNTSKDGSPVGLSALELMRRYL